MKDQIREEVTIQVASSTQALTQNVHEIKRLLLAQNEEIRQIREEGGVRGKKTDEMYDLLTKTRTGWDLVKLAFKLMTSLGLLAGAYMGINAFWHQVTSK